MFHENHSYTRNIPLPISSYIFQAELQYQILVLHIAFYCASQIALYKNIQALIVSVCLFLLLLFSCVGKTVNWHYSFIASNKFSKRSVHNFQHEQLVCPCFCKLYDLQIDVNTVSILIVRNNYMIFPNQICYLMF